MLSVLFNKSSFQNLLLGRFLPYVQNVFQLKPVCVKHFYCTRHFSVVDLKVESIIRPETFDVAQNLTV